MDVMTPSARSALMARIRAKNTGPEIIVRRILHSAGYRFRLHRKGLPGTPDIVLPRHRIVILVHGCFFHSHAGCKFAYVPKTRTRFWRAKFAANVARDRRVLRALRKVGWTPIVVWECETFDVARLVRRLTRRLPRNR
jgi:DNA mismatch endonuclease (patch repair protein)